MEMPKVSLPPNATEEDIGSAFTEIVQWLQARAEKGLDDMNNATNWTKPSQYIQDYMMNIMYQISRLQLYVPHDIMRWGLLLFKQ